MSYSAANRRQEGFVSIIVALILMIFVSLIALGFAFLARQNQIQSQNRVLSSQAFYAAESGVNDAIQELAKNLKSAGTLPPSKTDCSPITAANGQISSTNQDIKYTCVSYDTAPTSLEYKNVGTNDTRVVRMQSQSGNLQSITIAWQDTAGSKVFATNNDHFLPEKAFTNANPNNFVNNTGILRVSLIPFFAGNINRSDLSADGKVQTLFLYPKADATKNHQGTPDFLGSASISDSNQGILVDGHCNVDNKPRYCKVTINNLDNAQGQTDTFYVTLRSIYRASNIWMSATTSAGATAKLVNEQAVVDSTGKAADVLRRIQVRVPFTLETHRPPFSAETIDSLCKRLQLWPNGGNIASPTGGAIPQACNIN